MRHYWRRDLHLRIRLWNHRPIEPKSSKKVKQDRKDHGKVNREDHGKVNRKSRSCINSFQRVKLFERVHHVKLIASLKEVGLHDRDFKIIPNLYWNQTVQVKVGGHKKFG